LQVVASSRHLLTPDDFAEAIETIKMLVEGASYGV
jgi:hypothetical protein